MAIPNFADLITSLHSLNEPEEIGIMFREIARNLMNELCLIAGGEKYRITECEFYYDNTSKHQDPYLYPSAKNIDNFRKDQQKEKLSWFFHFAGMDVTIGNGDNIRGGILIRAIESIDRKYFMEKPLILVDHFLNTGNNNVFNGFILKLEPYEFAKKEIKQNVRKRLRNFVKRNPDIEGLSTYYDKEYNFSLVLEK